MQTVEDMAPVRPNWISPTDAFVGSSRMIAQNSAGSFGASPLRHLRREVRLCGSRCKKDPTSALLSEQPSSE